MRLQGKKLSHQARRQLNTLLVNFLYANLPAINDCCLVAELFGKERWHGRDLRKLRERMRALLVDLRVRHRDTPSVCEIRPLQDVQDVRPKQRWERLSTTAKAAFMGTDHSMIIKLEQKA